MARSDGAIMPIAMLGDYGTGITAADRLHAKLNGRVATTFKHGEYSWQSGDFLGFLACRRNTV